MATPEESYDVVLLVERPLTAAEAASLRTFHQELDDDPAIEVVYHVLLPVDDAPAAVEASLGIMGGTEVMAPTLDADEVAAIREANQEAAEADLAATITAIRETGAHVVGELVPGPVIDALTDKVKAVDGREVLVLTRSHLVAEFFHVDWTSRARRKLGVPVLHLIEHTD